jgi:hypothetical protein
LVNILSQSHNQQIKSSDATKNNIIPFFPFLN